MPFYSILCYTGHRIDTVGVCGSNPHAPTTSLDNLSRTHRISVAKKRSRFLTHLQPQSS